MGRNGSENTTLSVNAESRKRTADRPGRKIYHKSHPQLVNSMKIPDSDITQPVRHDDPLSDLASTKHNDTCQSLQSLLNLFIVADGMAGSLYRWSPVANPGKRRYEFAEPSDGFWGAEYPNGSWFGMMGMMQRKEVDLALGPFAISLDRSRVADFSVPILSIDHTIFYARQEVSPDLLGFIKPFTASVWSLLALALVLVTFVTLLVQSLAPQRPNPTKTVARVHGRHDRVSSSPTHGASNSQPKPVREFWLWGFMIILGQVLFLRRLGGGVRVCVSVWMLASFILAAVYKGNLKAMLIVPKVDIPFDNLEDLAQQREFPWLIAKGSLVHSFFQAAYQENPSSIMGQLWTHKASLLTTPSVVISKALAGNAGLYNRYTSIYRISKDFSQQGRCRFAVSRGGYMPVSYSMGFPKGSTLKPTVDKLINRLKEFGILEKFLSEGIGNATLCLTPKGGKQYTALRTLVVEDFMGIFSLYAAGMAIGVIMFLAELVHHRITLEHE
ncbi:glutamate receptor ionotropic, kainate 5-like [Panulirus ornatus]|uniref:glutamate receptor ionotropic, kainate 5-like n=1 Tax=Panulirus ornatus TaxID=150431 RepID=UPI003A89E7FE